MHKNSPFYDEKHKHVICYPEFNIDEFKHRVKELENLGIEFIEFVGQKRIRNVSVIGKGTVGIVVAAYRKGKRVALKIRRRDADRSTMQHEAKMLAIANNVGVGPELIEATENFLLMEFIQGSLFPVWLDSLVKDEAFERIRKVLHQVLEQAWALDQVGLDHGELSHAPKHIIVKEHDVPVVLDFESASTSRRVSNVTSITQFFYLGSPFASVIQNGLRFYDSDKLLDVLRAYKRENDRSGFDDVLKVLDLI